MPFTMSRPSYASDLHRPRYHFLPPSGWMNDPNGVIEIDGRHHLFYQYNPHGAVWDKIQWGHAFSDDLVHWHDQPVALTPDTLGLDETGVWSGCAVSHDNQVMLIYTGGTGAFTLDGIANGLRNMPICGAIGAPGLQTWHKLPENPLIAALPDDGDIIGQRDPVVWREGDRWRMSIGAGLRDRGGAALLYESPDLHRWDYVGLLHHEDVGMLWECPQLLTFEDDRAALIVNVWNPPQRAYSAYYSGTYRDGKFEAQFFEQLELENSAIYAPQATRDAQGRWIMWNWIREERSIEASVAAGWSGVMSLPRIVTMDAVGRLRQQSVPELQALRPRDSQPLRVAAQQSSVGDVDNRIVLGQYQSPMLEILVEFMCDRPTGQVELSLHMLPDALERVPIIYDWERGGLRIERQQSSLDSTGSVEVADVYGDLKLAAGEALKLHIFIDHSVIEVFANDGRATAVTRIYPTQNSGFEIGWQGTSGVTLKSAQVWDLDAI